jgi:hypothetical protein
MITIYCAVDGVAEGPLEVDPGKDLLSQVKKKFPTAKGTIAPDELNDGDVIIVKTSANDDKAT